MTEQHGTSGAAQPPQGPPSQRPPAEAQRKGPTPLWRTIRILIAAAAGCILFGVGVIVWNSVGAPSLEPLTAEKAEQVTIGGSGVGGDQAAQVLRFKEIVQDQLRPSYNPITILATRRKYAAEANPEDFALWIMDGGEAMYRYHQSGRVGILIGPEGELQVLVAPWEPDGFQTELAKVADAPN